MSNEKIFYYKCWIPKRDCQWSRNKKRER